MDVIDKKGKENVEENKKEPVFFKGVELVDLDDYDVLGMRLQCNSDDMDDNNTPYPEDMDIGNGGASSSQCLEPNAGPAAEPLQSSV